MALKNKDGSVYRLATPNPIMKTQTLWGNEQFTLHNMKWTSEKYQDTIQIKTVQQEPKEETFISDLEESKSQSGSRVIETNVSPKEIQKQESKVYERKTEVHEDKQRIEENIKSEIEKVFIYLLPANIRTKRDDLYGDIVKTVEYGKPTSFEAVELEQQDFYFKIWTDIDISLGSILYPKTNFKRWWKVKDKEKKADGWILTSMPSDYQPSFES